MKVTTTPPLLCSLLLLLLLLITEVAAWDPTPPPTRPPGVLPVPRDDNQSIFENPVNAPIYTALKEVHIVKWAQIPNFKSPGTGRTSASRLVGVTSYGDSAYVTTSTAGAYIYRIPPDRKPILWADVQTAVLRDTGRNVNCETAQHGGLRGVAFPPNHAKTGLFYVSYMEDRPKVRTKFRYLSRPEKERPIVADSVVVEFKYDFAAKTIVNGSYRAVIRIGLETKDHPIKQIAFQGYNLLIGHGDGAQGSKPSPGGMNDDGLGKIIRVDPRRLWSKNIKGFLPYRIPKDNPWAKKPPGGGKRKYMPELYAVGFRNPHNICVSKRYGIFVADVGRDNVEEVNIVTPGGNYGWGEREGTFVNKYDGGTITGIGALPKNDSLYGYTYPVVQIGHSQPVGGQIRWGLAIAGACPVETPSELKHLYFYAHFGERGELWYSWVGAMKRAVTKGRPDQLTQANVFRVKKIWFYKDVGATPVLVDSLVGVIRADLNRPKARRVDARFGRGPRGEILFTSKVSGAVYMFVNSLPKGAKV